MTWTKTSDDFPDDCWALSDAAYRLHHEGLTWSNRKLLDCRIPKADVRRFAKCPQAVSELLDVGFWADAGDAYVIRHHAAYQRSREQIIAMQERNRENGKKGGRPTKVPREVWAAPETHVGNPVANPDGNPQGQDRSGQVRTGFGRRGLH